MKDLIDKAEVLVEALPYIRRFYDTTIVVKYGGSAMSDESLRTSFARDVVLLKYIGLRPVIVHGGGPQIGRTLERIGKPSTFVDGFSVSTSGIMIGVVMGLVVPFVAALIPVILGTRVSILEAMTDTGISSNYGRGLLARAINIAPLPTNTKQAISNVMRKKGRMLLTWLTLTMAMPSSSLSAYTRTRT